MSPLFFVYELTFFTPKFCGIFCVRLACVRTSHFPVIWGIAEIRESRPTGLKTGLKSLV